MNPGNVLRIVLALAIGYLLFNQLATRGGDGAAQRPEMTTQAPAYPRAQSSDRPQSGTPLPPAMPATAARSVAVLPFAVRSNGPDDDYFADGLSGEITHALAQLPELQVTGRASAFHFKGRNLPTADIGRQLRVAHLVNGSVQRGGERLRVTAHLTSVHDGSRRWSQTYERHTDETRTVQLDIAEQVAIALGVAPDEPARTRMERAGVRSVEAWIRYQKGLELFERAHRGNNLVPDLRLANAYFAGATESAPAYARAHLASTDLYAHILRRASSGRLDGSINPSDVAEAHAALQRHYILALRHAADSDSKAIVEHDRALILGQWNAQVAWSGAVLSSNRCATANWIHLSGGPFGRAPNVYSAFEQLSRCDPLLPRPWARMVEAKLWQGDISGAVAAGRAGFERARHDATVGELATALALALAADGRRGEAGQTIQARLRRERDKLIAGFMVAAVAGDAGVAGGYRDRFLAGHGPDDAITLIMAAALGERNEANRLAAQIDQRPAGYLVLLESTYHCICGAPFDLQAVPAFAERLRGSGLYWPPTTPLQFPLKKW